jgi:predicted AAA+ superfamily ATPase
MTSVDAIKAVIADQERDFKTQMSSRIIEREFSINERKLSSGAVGIITGIRRCGKSVLAQLSFSGQRFGYINFEDARLSVVASELNKVIEAIYSLKGPVSRLVFDEIQNVHGWEKFVGRLAASKKVIITGSNARLMSKELATFMVGRHIDFELFPFSFREFLTYGSTSFGKPYIYTTEGKAAIMGALEEYIKVGGMPQAYSLGGGYLSGLYTEILQRDVAQRYNIKHTAELKELANYLASNFASEITSNKLKGIVNIKTANTVSKWIGYLESTYLFFKLERFSSKLKDRIKAPKKIYMMDTGILRSVYSESGGMKGKMMENLAAIEIKRRIAYWHKDHSLYYWKGGQQEEVDFLLRKSGRTVALLQVTYASGRKDIKERELKSLIKASADQKCSNLILISWDYSGEIKFGGKKIKVIPLWRWLIDYNSYSRIA